MKKIAQTILVAIGLLAAGTAMQASAQTSKAPAAIRNAKMHEGKKEWHGKNEGKGEWRGGKNEGKGEWRGGKNEGWRLKWRANDPNQKLMGARAYAASVNVNTASSAQLSRLPNVGPQTAASIIRNRPYRNIAQFRSANKRFISPLEWRKISRRVRL